MVPIRLSSLVSLIQKCFLITTTSSSLSAAISSPKLSSNSQQASTISSSSLTYRFLTDSCGLPLQYALSVSKKFQIDQNKLQNSRSVLQLLKAYHFSDSHIAKLIQRHPRVLHSKVESNLKPKFEFLIENGIVGKLLHELVTTNPAILQTDLDSYIKPHFKSFKSLLGCNENIVAVLKRSPWLFSFGCKNSLQQNIDFLMTEGVPFDRVKKLCWWHPTVMKFKHDRVISAVNALKNLGIKPEATIFVHALGVMIPIDESRWREKIEMMKSLGWSEEEVLLTFKRFPIIFRCSEKKIRFAMDFFMNTMKLEQNVIITNPCFLGYSIDKRVRPRYNVMKVLQSKKLVEIEKNICSWLVVTEKKFLENYVSKYMDKIPDLLELYRGTEK